VVCASDRLPEPWRGRLVALCARVPQVALRFLPPMDVLAAQARAFGELGVELADAVRFRLDDDCVFADFVRLLRRAARALRGFPRFAVSVPDVLLSVTTGPHRGVRTWQAPFLSAGAAIRHPSRSIYGFGHFALPQRLPALTLPGHHALVTQDGANDSARSIGGRVGQLRPVDDEALRAILQRDLPFLGSEGLAVVGLSGAPGGS
jgi:hypothetical protein